MEYKAKAIIEDLEGSKVRELKSKIESIKLTDRKTGEELECKFFEDYGSYWQYDLPPLDPKTDKQLKLIIADDWEEGFVLEIAHVEEDGIIEYASNRKIIQFNGRNKFNTSSVGLTELEQFFKEVVEELSKWPHIRIEARGN